MLSQIIADWYQILTTDYTTWRTDECGEYYRDTKAVAYVDYAYQTGDGIETREDWILGRRTMISLFLGLVRMDMQAGWDFFITKTMSRFNSSTLEWWANELFEMAHDIDPSMGVSGSIAADIGIWLYRYVDLDTADYVRDFKKVPERSDVPF